MKLKKLLMRLLPLLLAVLIAVPLGTTLGKYIAKDTKTINLTVAKNLEKYKLNMSKCLNIAGKCGFSEPKIVFDNFDNYPDDFIQTVKTQGDDTVGETAGQIYGYGDASNETFYVLSEGLIQFPEDVYGFLDQDDEPNLTSIKEVTFKNCDTSTTTNFERFVYGRYPAFNNLTLIDFSSFDFSKATTMYHMIHHVWSQCTIIFPTDPKLGPDMTSMEEMFYENKGITSLNLSAFDTSKVTTMANMFVNCESLQTLDLSGKFVVAPTHSGMFNNCYQLETIYASESNYEGIIEAIKASSGVGSSTALQTPKVLVNGEIVYPESAKTAG